jgi:hypothetical protein
MPWDWLRIGLLYGPVWLIILVTFGIYARAGRQIYLQLKQLRELGMIGDWTENETHNSASGDTETHWISSPHSQADESGTLRLQTSMHSTSGQSHRRNQRERAGSDPAIAAWAYSKYALLFFIALLVTWVCQSLYNFSHGS